MAARTPTAADVYTTRRRSTIAIGADLLRAPHIWKTHKIVVEHCRRSGSMRQHRTRNFEISGSARRAAPQMTALEMARGPACCAEPLISKHQPACKPGFVGHRPLARTIRDGHSSGTMFAHGLEQPTRTAGLTSPSRCFRLHERARVAVPIRSCSRCGLPCRFRCRNRGALLPHLFTLASSEEEAVRSLWHCPWGRPRRMLSGTVCRWSPDFPLPLAFRPSRERPSGRLTR